MKQAPDVPSLLTSVKPGYTTISPDRNTVVSFDREGRLYSYFKDALTYRRTMASHVELRWRANGRQRRRLSVDEAAALFRQAYQKAADSYSFANTKTRRRLDQEILRWTPERLLAEGERFARVYQPISILPPDQYLSIVLQATEGCTWNRCTFCTFYQDRPFRAKSESEFAGHVGGVHALFGKGALMRKGVFLADGNALALSQRRIEPLMEITRQQFPDRPIYSFIDVYTGERRSIADWKRLKDLGLQRVYIGMETGLDELLGFLNKPGSCEELVAFVDDLKEAGLAVSLIVMIGVGGTKYVKSHAEATLNALAQMRLGPGDLIYLSPFIEHPESTYARLREEAGLTPLSEHEIAAELTRLAKIIRASGVKAARYDIREFMY